MTTDQLPDLVQEFRTQVGLTDIDSHRSAFTALAYNHGWSPARIGRYLGISRARVGQRIEKLRGYVQTYEMPLLIQLIQDADPTRVDGPDLPVAFELSSWYDKEFAMGMLRQAAA